MLVALGLAALSAYSTAARDSDPSKPHPDREPKILPRPFGWPVTRRMDNGVTDARNRANAYGISFTQQSPTQGVHAGGDFSVPAYVPAEAFTPADRASQERTTAMAYQNDIPFSGYNNSANSWNRRNIKTLPNADPFVADFYVPRSELFSNGLGPWPRDSAIGPVFTEKVLYDVDFVSTTDFNYSHGPSDPIFHPELDPELQQKRFEGGVFV